jgi:hypothetical protein
MKMTAKEHAARERREPGRVATAGSAERRLARGAAITSLFLGLGFGLPCLYGVWYFATRHEVWNFLGFPTYGDGPFEANGIPTTVPLLIGFLIVCALEVATGGLLWAPRPSGYWIGILLLPFEAVYWIGFDLPFGPLLGIARTVLIVVAVWSRAHRQEPQPPGKAQALVRTPPVERDAPD